MDITLRSVRCLQAEISMAAADAGRSSKGSAHSVMLWTGGASWSVATYLAANSLISLVAVYLASEIHNQRPAERAIAPQRG